MVLYLREIVQKYPFLIDVELTTTHGKSENIKHDENQILY